MRADICIMKRGLVTFLFFVFLLIWPSFTNGELRYKREDPRAVRVPVLLYHRFGSGASGSMTVATAVFRSHLEYLRDKGFTVIPLRHLVNYYLKKGPPPLPGSVVIVAEGRKGIS